jgi:hypothetical protein
VWIAARIDAVLNGARCSGRHGSGHGGKTAR